MKKLSTVALFFALGTLHAEERKDMYFCMTEKGGYDYQVSIGPGQRMALNSEDDILVLLDNNFFLSYFSLVARCLLTLLMLKAKMFIFALTLSSTLSVQNANCVVMVPPKEFKFNEETAQDNEFQNRVNLTEAEVKLETMAEFWSFMSLASLST